MPHKIITGLLLFFFSLPVLSCIDSAPRIMTKLSFYDKTRISGIIELEYPQFKGLENARTLDVFGLVNADSVKIEFPPHAKATNGADLSHVLSCSVNKKISDWRCRLPEEKSSGYYAETDDYYQLADDVPATTAEHIAQLLHDELVINELGYFRYTIVESTDKEAYSKHALNIAEIKRHQRQGHYKIMLEPDFRGGCSSFVVTVQEHGCSSDTKDCTYKIRSSVMSVFL